MRPVRVRFSSMAVIVASGCLIAGLSGCSSDQQPQNIGAESGTKTPPRPTGPSEYKTYLESSSKEKAVQRRTQTNKLDVDLLVTVRYAGGKVTPTLEDLSTQVGDEVEVDVTSDKAQKISVSGHPDADSDVGPGESEDVDFTVQQEGRITVSLEPSGTDLVTFVATG